MSLSGLSKFNPKYITKNNLSLIDIYFNAFPAYTVLGIKRGVFDRWLNVGVHTKQLEKIIDKRKLVIKG